MKVLKCEVDREQGMVKINATGTEEHLSIEARAIIGGIYREIWKEDKDAAERFRIKLLSYLVGTEFLVSLFGEEATNEAD